MYDVASSGLDAYRIVLHHSRHDQGPTFPSCVPGDFQAPVERGFHDPGRVMFDRNGGS